MGELFSPLRRLKLFCLVHTCAQHRFDVPCKDDPADEAIAEHLFQLYKARRCPSCRWLAIRQGGCKHVYVLLSLQLPIRLAYLAVLSFSRSRLAPLLGAPTAAGAGAGLTSATPVERKHLLKAVLAVRNTEYRHRWKVSYVARRSLETSARTSAQH